MHLHKHLLFLLLLFDFFQSTRFKKKKKNALSSNPIDMKSLGDDFEAVQSTYNMWFITVLKF